MQQSSHSPFRAARLGMAALFAAMITLSTACSPLRDALLGGATPPTSSSSALVSSMDSELRIHIINVGNADSILIQSEGKSLLIDAGENNDGDDVVAYLRSHNVQSLDYAIATHPDADHIGGMDVVVNEIPIGTFIMSIMPEAITPTTKTYLDMLDALDSKNVNVAEANPGNQYTLGKSAFTILGPVGEFDSTNNMSVVCRVDFGARRFLFMGDAEKEAENALLAANADLKADFIKLGHHGSHSSSQEKFLKAVNPRYAAITCGSGNKYGHPHEETLSTLKKLKITYSRCDLNGTITVTSDGNAINVTTLK